MIQHRPASYFSSALLAACLAAACLGVQAQTAAPSQAQIKAQQELAAAQAAADRATREAAESQATMQHKASQQAAQKAAAAEATRQAQTAGLCDSCGIVKEVRSEKRQSKGDGRTVAVVGGAAGATVVGNGIQQRISQKTIHISIIEMKDGSKRTHEAESAPTWVVGNKVKLNTAANTLTRL